MRIDHDCIRDLLLYLEDRTGIFKDTFIEHDNKFKYIEVSTHDIYEDEILSGKYQPDAIVYTLLKLQEAGMIETDLVEMGDGSFYGFRITDITWQGHEFLGTIRDDTTWNRTKQKAAKLGVSSVKGLSSLAWQLFIATISNPDILQKI